MISEITSMEQLADLVRAGVRDFKHYGEVNAIWYDTPLGLVQFNYTQAAQWKPVHEWNWFERNSRGLILNSQTGEIIARPFRKFFNYGQDEPSPTAQIADITEKMDGSLGILFQRNGEWRIATRGSLLSDQAQWATTWWRQHIAELDDHSWLSADITLLFEIIYPGNRIVVDYQGYEGLVLIGAVRNRSGQSASYSELTELAKRLDLRLPLTYDFSSWQQILSAATALSVNEEGWVVRMTNDERYKIKGSAYKIAHRIMTGVTFSRVLEAVASGEFERMIEGVPDEFLVYVKAWHKEIEDTVVRFQAASAERLTQAPATSRKEFALWVQSNVPKSEWGYMFAALDGKPLRPLILKSAFNDRPNAHWVAVVEEG